MARAVGAAVVSSTPSNALAIPPKTFAAVATAIVLASQHVGHNSGVIGQRADDGMLFEEG